jgi:hypothetical protein
MSTLLQFPTRHKANPAMVEMYAELLEKRSALMSSQHLIIDNSNSNRRFSGCHNSFGALSEPTYRLLLAFSNQPTDDNWSEIRDLRIFGRMTSFNILEDCYPDYTEPRNHDKTPSADSFAFAFSVVKQKFLMKQSLLLNEYQAKIDEIEKEFPELKTIFKVK